jgi:hypothetical protein
MLRLSIGLASLTLSILFVAQALGLVPDREAAIMEGRKTLCQAMAIQCSLDAQRNDLQTVLASARLEAERNPDIVSLGVRKTSGDLVVEVGDHKANWIKLADDHSTTTQMQVPIALEDKLWGTMEFRFKPLAPPGILGLTGGPNLRRRP